MVFSLSEDSSSFPQSLLSSEFSLRCGLSASQIPPVYPTAHRVCSQTLLVYLTAHHEWVARQESFCTRTFTEFSSFLACALGSFLDIDTKTEWKPGEAVQTFNSRGRGR